MTMYYPRGRFPGGSWTASTFDFVKTVEFSDRLLKKHVDEKYKVLQNLSFNRVHIPKFSYEVTEHEIIHHIEFIKGTQMNPISFMCCNKLIYEDLVNNGKEWGFHSIHPEDFIFEDITNKLYLVDFESFCKMSLKEKVIDYQNTIKGITEELKQLKEDIKSIEKQEQMHWLIDTHHFWK